MTEQALAARLHRDLGQLAIDAGWTTDASADQPQGNYSDPIADAKETAGIAGDLAAAPATAVQKVRRLALGVCFDRLALHYTTAVDHSEDGMSENLSQILINIERARMLILGNTAVGVSLRGTSRPDWMATGGNVPL